MASLRNGVPSMGLRFTLALVLANALILYAIYLFADGFFPYKPLLSGLAEYDTVEFETLPAAPFDRVVFVVIDALRSDFVYTANSGFKFTQSLINDGVAIPFTAHATSPTVTMPRLKAITTGSVPSFLDVVLNLAEGDESSSLASQDTWLAQMKAKGTGKLVMYGDDTWLKLFPDIFDRYEGTTSFFVSDFTEVDHNVTRHIAGELKNDDWNTMVLHYLGLDHIGHKGGPRSPHMLGKQQEMDNIIKQIYTAIETEPHLSSTLLVVCGDHGMNDAGNHGASSPGETSPALVFMSPALSALETHAKAPAPDNEGFQYYETVEQSDIAPTLAALLGFPNPQNSLGSVIPRFLSLWENGSDQAQLLVRNARQIQTVINTYFQSQLFAEELSADDCANAPTDYHKLACEWQTIYANTWDEEGSVVVGPVWQTPLVNWLRKAQELLSGMASNYDLGRLVQAGSFAFLALILINMVIDQTSGSSGKHVVVAAIVISHGLMAFACKNYVGEELRFLYWIPSFFSFIGYQWVAGPSARPLAAITLAYSVMMFASSYVEEEQQFWYWATTGWFAFIGYKSFRKATNSRARRLIATIIVLLATRLMRGWNQTGQKFAGDPDIVKSFLYTNPYLLWFLVTLTYIIIHRNLIYGFSGRLPTPVVYPVMTGLLLAAFTFKVAFTHEDAPELVVSFAQTLLDLSRGATLVARAKAVFFGIALVAVAGLYCVVIARKKVPEGSDAINIFHHLFTLLAVTQSRTTNIPLFLIFHIQRWFLSYLQRNDSSLTASELSISSILLQFASFFAFGGTNAISSVDLSSAYNGVAGYDVIAVGILTFVSNWAAPIWWVSSTVILMLRINSDGTVESSSSSPAPVVTVSSTESFEPASALGPSSPSSDDMAKAEREAETSQEQSNSWSYYPPISFTNMDPFCTHILFMTAFIAHGVAAVMAACAHLRTHLFIWTVFSPKYLYCVAWAVGQHIIVNIGLGGLLYALGRWEQKGAAARASRG